MLANKQEHPHGKNMENLIFEKPSLAPLSNRVGWAFFTAFFWMVWIYLWLPVITLGMWVLGFSIYGDYFLHNSSTQVGNMKHLFVLYLSVIAVLGGGLLAWARTEFVRFRNVNRRTRPLPTEIEELADFAHIRPETMAQLVTVRRMVVHHDTHGKFLRADILG